MSNFFLLSIFLCGFISSHSMIKQYNNNHIYIKQNKDDTHPTYYCRILDGEETCRLGCEKDEKYIELNKTVEKNCSSIITVTKELIEKCNAFELVTIVSAMKTIEMQSGLIDRPKFITNISPLLEFGIKCGMEIQKKIDAQKAFDAISKQ